MSRTFEIPEECRWAKRRLGRRLVDGRFISEDAASRSLNKATIERLVATGIFRVVEEGADLRAIGIVTDETLSEPEPVIEPEPEPVKTYAYKRKSGGRK